MKKLLTLVVLVAFVCGGAALVVAADKGPAEVKLESPKMGKTFVSFPHAAHQEKVPDCATCHHTGLDQPKCSSCHGADPAAPKAKKAYHKLCIDCHKAEKAGPTKCKECHTKG